MNRTRIVVYAKPIREYVFYYMGCTILRLAIDLASPLSAARVAHASAVVRCSMWWRAHVAVPAAP
jgi:hypothetical protein